MKLEKFTKRLGEAGMQIIILAIAGEDVDRDQLNDALAIMSEMQTECLLFGMDEDTANSNCNNFIHKQYAVMCAMGRKRKPMKQKPVKKQTLEGCLSNIKMCDLPDVQVMKSEANNEIDSILDAAWSGAEIDESDVDMDNVRKMAKHATLICSVIKSNMASYQIPTNKLCESKLSDWVSEIRLMVDNDGFTFDDIKDAKNGLRVDPFWRQQVQSIGSFRKYISKILLNFRSQKEASVAIAPKSSITTQEEADRYLYGEK